MDLTSKAGSNAALSIQSDEGSSPRHNLSLQARISLPKRFEFDPVWRYVSALPGQFPAGLPADYVKATQRVYHTAEMPSHLELLEVPK